MKPYLLFASFLLLILLFVLGAAFGTPGFMEAAKRALERAAMPVPESSLDSGTRPSAFAPASEGAFPAPALPEDDSPPSKRTTPRRATIPTESGVGLAAPSGGGSVTGRTSLRPPVSRNRRPVIKMPPPPSSATRSHRTPRTLGTAGDDGRQTASDPRPPRAVEAAFAMAGQIRAPGGSGTRGVDAVQNLVGLYQRTHQGEVPPVMDNQGLVSALSGDNPANLRFLPPAAETPAINEEGLLVDQWGTPFALHLESRREMEIRSAGPDKQLWTVDDLTTQ